MKKGKNKVRLKPVEALFKNKNHGLFSSQKGFDSEAKNQKPFCEEKSLAKTNFKKYI